MLAPGCLPLFTSDSLNLYFYAALGPFWTLAPGSSSRQERSSVADGGWPDLWSGEKTLPAANPRHGSRQNAPTMDGTRAPRVPLVKGFRLSGLEARRELDPVPGRWVKVPAEELGGSQIRARQGRSGRLIEEKTGPSAICRGSLNYPPSLTGAPTQGIRCWKECSSRPQTNPLQIGR